MGKKLIYNARIVLRDRLLNDGAVLLEDGRIKAVMPSFSDIPEAEKTDAQGNYLSPGFIDIHLHGGGGSEFMDCTGEDCRRVARAHMEHGTTTMYPTTLACTNDELYRFFDIYDALKNDTGGARFGGLHLEGPYFAYNFRGAQDPKYLRNPSPEEYMDILERASDIVRWDMAPELPGALEFADELCRRGILPSIAHTEAIYSDVVKAFSHGFTHLTHFYSCMNGITRMNGFRRGGCVEAGYLMDGLTLELITDGCHVPVELLQLTVKIKGPERVALITDSMRAAGQQVSESTIGSRTNGQHVLIEDGVAKLPDRQAFAGSIATTDRLLRVMWKSAGVPLWDTVRMMTETTARIMGAHDRGVMAPGYDGDLVMFEENASIKGVWIKGERTI